MNNETQNSSDDGPHRTRPLAYNVTEIESVNTVGAGLLGMLALILLIALLRCHGRNRALLAELWQERQ